MTQTPKAWIRERKNEFYYKKAKAENYRSRSTYKLVQANNKYGFIKPHDVVVDLGAAPGGWIQAARKMTGKHGFVLGIDLKPIEPFTQEYIRTIVADLTEPNITNQILSFLPRPPDVVISDAAPNVTGVWEVDHACQIDLANKALEIAKAILKPGGNFFVKVFQGDLLNEFTADIKDNFESVRIVKPQASRAKSSEEYILALDLKKGTKTES
ncbi:MAG: RlmE family RNA methyltransferase [Nitrososphaerota archaeon]|jgi:23S rRNA (uridine2552-2'-O)-methyltransferase|uniref:RlmE family RNA methyltransferase n=1 Tax=Candidatus Bathycorpusculum sp. TaxID=2994959 RepID=UPI002827A4C5|nr:RlmE family RNA methyltransferase [Candidatus Termitimicrobium sp.]MCL2432618.1 RlmE family RNA methyltransferase [Candidatus Termitimicrobium sp.]MDR0493637.1 RlmE family RNA methyltransferase [Nitrososphaerota archaeon]